jgi:hypothetical protein
MRTYSPYLLVAAMFAPGCGLALGLDDFETTGEDGSGGSGAAGSTASTGGGASGASSTTSSATGATGGGGASGSSSSSGSGAQGGEGGGPVCPSTHTCVPEAPQDWVGPLALFSSPSDQGPPACVGDYGTNQGDFHADLEPGAASCQCTCDPAQGIQCTGSANVCFYSNSLCIQACTGNNTPIPSAGAGCTPIGFSSSSTAVVTPPAPSAIGSCLANANHVLPTPTWATDLRACGGAAAEPTGCDAGQLCAPLTPGASKMCLLHAGDVACPNAFFAEKHVGFESFTDTRSCSACSCGTANSVCGGTVNFTQMNCSILVSKVSGCGPKNVGSAVPDAAKYAPAPSGTCPPAGGQLSGSVNPQTAVTFCCH